MRLDNLTHSLFGAHLARLPPLRRVPQRLGLWTCVAASNVPDLDFLLQLFGEDRYVFEHRGITHSLVGLLVLAPATAAVAAAASRRWRLFPGLVAVAAAGVLGHLALDVITSWGTMLLAPFSDRRFLLPWLFIADPLVWLLLGVPLAWGAWRRRHGGVPDRILRRTSSTALLVLACYVLVAAVAHHRARRAALSAALERPGNPVEVLAFPSPPGPLIWTTLVRTDEHVWQRGFASALTGGVVEAGVFATGATDPRVQVALGTGLGARWAGWAEAPIRVEVTPLAPDGTYEIVLADLRFSGPFWDRTPFGLWMRIGPSFEVRDWEFRSVRVSPDASTPAPDPMAGREGP